MLGVVLETKAVEYVGAALEAEDVEYKCIFKSILGMEIVEYWVLRWKRRLWSTWVLCWRRGRHGV